MYTCSYHAIQQCNIHYATPQSIVIQPRHSDRESDASALGAARLGQDAGQHPGLGVLVVAQPVALEVEQLDHAGHGLVLGQLHGGQGGAVERDVAHGSGDHPPGEQLDVARVAPAGEHGEDLDGAGKLAVALDLRVDQVRPRCGDVLVEVAVQQTQTLARCRAAEDDLLLEETRQARPVGEQVVHLGGWARQDDHRTAGVPGEEVDQLVHGLDGGLVLGQAMGVVDKEHLATAELQLGPCPQGGVARVG